MSNSLNIRIKELIDELGLSQAEFAEKLSIYPSRVSNVVKGKNKPDADFLAIISEKFQNVNLKWLLNGEGEILTSEQKGYKTPSREITVAADPAGVYHRGIPLIPAEALAGYGNGDFVVHQADVIQRYVIPDFSNADFLIPVKGESMLPTYKSGDIVACKKRVKTDFIQWNCIYVLDTTQGILLKRIIKGARNGHWVLRSDNKEFQDIEVNPVTDVRHISIVIGGIKIE